MDACETQRNNWDELDVTKEELQNLNECLKKEEFRKLLIEYAEEVTNPENRKIYQDEITQLERERGVDVTFVNPEPGYVIKTSVNGEKKCFINISKSDTIQKPTSQPSHKEGNHGLQWAIPYTLSPPRDDLDKKKNRCTVFDVVFHPDTLYLASKNPRFREIVNNTALDGVENNFKVKLDRRNIKFPNIDFKGIGHSTVIRKKCDKPVQKNVDVEPEIYQKFMTSYDEARERSNRNYERVQPSRPAPVTTYLSDKSQKIEDKESHYTTPKFLVKHQTDLDIQDFRNAKDSLLHAAIPKNLVVVIDLPLLKVASDATLDVQERLLSVLSEKPAKYRLELPLPYRVDPDRGNAKFDMTKRKLTVLLPVIRDAVQLCDFKDDSGVESDHGGSPPLELIVEQDAGHSVNDLMITDHEKVMDHGKYKKEKTSSNNDLINRVEMSFNENGDEVFRTNDSLAYEEPLMNDNIKYLLPHFNCTIFEDLLALTVDVKNVDTSSICHKILGNNSGIHIVLSSVGSGFFPIYYALCFKICDGALSQKEVVVEPWDNNVVFTIRLNDLKDSRHYYVGLDEEFMEAKDLPHLVCLEHKLESLVRETEEGDDKPRQIEVYKKDDQVIVNIHPNHLDSDDEDGENYDKKFRGDSKFRLASESSGDEIASSSGSTCRGILKNRRSFSRSVSESSIDDPAGILSSVEFNYDSVHELYSESDCSSLKKTVRFNDVVSRQLFRSNSSILGRRKKNQRKLRKKKQAHERRMSESENSETEERDKFKVKTKNVPQSGETTDNISKPIILKSHEKNGDKPEDYENVDLKTEFKNDLIFDLDM